MYVTSIYTDKLYKTCLAGYMNCIPNIYVKLLRTVTSKYCLLLPKYNAIMRYFPTFRTDATIGAGSAYPSGAHQCTPGFQWGSCYSIFSFMCMFCRLLFVLLSFFFQPLCCLSFFDLRILIISLVSSNSSYHWVCNKSYTTGVNIGTGTAYIIEFNPDFSCGSFCSVCSSSYCFWSPWHLQAFLTPIKSMKHIWILKYSKVSNLDLWKYVCINIKLHVCTCKTSDQMVQM